MEIGYAVNAFYPVNGGTETYVKDLADFISNYHNVHVYTSTAKYTDDFRIIRNSNEKLTVKHHKIGKIDVYRSDITQIPYISAKGFVEKFTQNYRANQSMQNILLRQITVLLNWGFSFGICKHLLHDKLDIIHFTSLPLLHTYSDSLIAKLRGIPSVFFPSFHRGSDHEAFLNRIPFQFATKVVVHGLDEKQDIQRFFRVPDEKIEIIPLPINMKDFTIDVSTDHFPELLKQEGIPKVLFIGRLTHTKGFIFLVNTMIELWKQNIDVDLIYVGVPTAESKIIEPLLKRYPERAFHYQNISHEEKIQLLRICDILILPSIVESWGMVFMEGWSQKKPVIGVTGQCYGEFIKNDINGFTVPFLDTNVLGEKIKILINDTKLAKKLGQNGFELVEKKFTVDVVYPKYLTIYEEIAKK